MQNRITEKVKLLDSKGRLTNPGYATKSLFEYNRNDIKANKLRIKEWDYYYVGNENYAICLTVSDNSYMGLASVTFLDFKNVSQNTATEIKLFPLGRTRMPSTPEYGETEFKSKDLFIKFANDGKERTLICSRDNFEKGKPIEVNIKLSNFPEESMVIATPFAEDKKAFYYNQKVNCMKATGCAKIGDKMYSFDNNNSLGTLDWGRGVWTYKNTWYWGSLSTVLPNGDLFGFNIGYGFGDTSKATENMLFYNGKAHKLSHVKFNIPTKNGKEDYLSRWTFTSDDGRFEMEFQPLINRDANLNIGILCSVQNQVFGYFMGKAVLDDGSEITLNKALGFAEKVFNKW